MRNTATPNVSSATKSRLPERSVAMPTGACSEAALPKLPMLLRLPPTPTPYELTLLLPWLLANRKLSFGLSRTTLELIAVVLNGLPATDERTPFAPMVHASAKPAVALASAPKSKPLVELKSRPASVPVPASAKGDPATAVSDPSGLMEKTETLAPFETARSCPLAEIFMLAFGTTGFAAVESDVSTPPAPMLKVLIWPLLEAIRKRPSGVALREIPEHESSVKPEANGKPAATVNAPLVGSIAKALMVWSPPLETNSRLLPALRARRFTEEQAAFAPRPPVATGEPARAVSVPSTATE